MELCSIKYSQKALMFRLNILTYPSYDKTETSPKGNLRLWKTLQWFAICPWVFRKNAF